MDCGDQNRYHRFPTIIISQIYIVQFFPTSLPTGLKTSHKVICYIIIKSLLGNEMLYNSWLQVLHITYFWSPTIYWKPSVTTLIFSSSTRMTTNMFSNPSLVQLTWKNPWLTQCLLTVLLKKINEYNPKTISNLTVSINQQHYHYCWCKTWNMDNNKPLFIICYTVTVAMVNKNKFTN